MPRHFRIWQWRRLFALWADNSRGEIQSAKMNILDHLIAFVSYLKVPTCGYKRMLISQAKDKTAEPYAVLLFRAGTL